MMYPQPPVLREPGALHPSIVRRNNLMSEMDESARPVEKPESSMTEITPMWRSFRRRVSSVTVEELRRLFDWSLPGPRIYQLRPGEPLYPCRPSERREISKGNYREWQEFPCRDQNKWTYQTGRFTTWLRTAEMKEALSHGHLIACHEALIFVRGNEDRRRWAKLRREVFKRDGRRCMRCGSVNGEMHVDHIKPWQNFPELRYDVGNLQVLCRACHEWKGAQDRARGPRKDEG